MCTFLILYLLTLQLHFNVRKMQQCGFVYLFLLLYPPFLVCKVFFGVCEHVSKYVKFLLHVHMCGSIC